MGTSTEAQSIIQTTLTSFTESSEFRSVLAQIQRGARVVSVSGLVAAPARALAIAALQKAIGKQLALVVPAQRDLEGWERDINFWYCALHAVTKCEYAVVVLPASERDPYAGASPHAETLERRALALWRLAQRQPELVLLTSRALARRTIAPKEISGAGALLRRDEDTAPEELIEKLLAGGYVRQD